MSRSPRRSALLTGRVRHRRFAPREHELSYGVYHVLLDLDELEDLDREVRGFGLNRAAVASFQDRDHLGPADVPVREKLRLWVEAQGVRLPDGPVLLHTNLRVLGHVFNPVSWFLCHDRDGRLALIVAEVNNTFGESHAYLLDELEWTGDHRVEARSVKRFHVSPFLDIADHEYRFVVRPLALEGVDGERFAVHMDVLRGGERILDATNAETRTTLTTATLWRALLRYPLVTVLTVAAIHWEALRLWVKRVPFFRKPEPPEDGFLRPARRGQRHEPSPSGHGRDGREPSAADQRRPTAHDETLEHAT